MKMNIQIDNYWNFLWILAFLFIFFLWLKFSRWRKEKRRIFAEKKFHSFLFSNWEKERIIIRLYFLAFSFLVMAILGIISKEKTDISTTEKVDNIIFLVDISNSMNAQDVAPSRLEQAKNIIREMLHQLTNERVGIVVFAGEAQSLIPLTNDYSSANIFINQLSSNMIQRQGTDFLLAVKEASKKLNHISGGKKKIILISDGEDNEGNHNTAIREAKNQGISIISVGIGTEEGAPIPELLFNLYSDYKKDENGQIVITKRETEALKSIADDTGGVYIDGNQQSSTNAVISAIQSGKKSEIEKTMQITQNIHYYQWFLGISLMLFFVIFMINPKRDLDF